VPSPFKKSFFSDCGFFRSRNFAQSLGLDRKQGIIRLSLQFLLEMVEVLSCIDFQELAEGGFRQHYSDELGRYCPFLSKLGTPRLDVLARLNDMGMATLY
jgi:hypothetical protein